MHGLASSKSLHLQAPVPCSLVFLHLQHIVWHPFWHWQDTSSKQSCGMAFRDAKIGIIEFCSLFHPYWFGTGIVRFGMYTIFYISAWLCASKMWNFSASLIGRKTSGLVVFPKSTDLFISSINTIRHFVQLADESLCTFDLIICQCTIP